MQEQQLFDLINNIDSNFIHQLDEILQNEIGLNYFQFQLLDKLEKYSDGSKQEQLVAELNVDKSTVSRQLRSQALKGLITRSQSEISGREKNVQLTINGTAKLILGKELTEQFTLDFFKVLS